ncbi:MAG: 50S ribosomal protein L10 [Candidatus Woesearchaeota archaeon]
MDPKISNHKKKVVKEFSELLDQYPVIGALDVEKLPAKQLTEMRRKLRGIAHIKMTKRRLLNVAIDDSKKENIGELKQHLKGMPALLFAKDNPFKLFKILKKNKSPAPIKGGEVAPKDIVVKAGATGFAPGPIIGELGSFGIKAGIDAGKVAIKEDKVVAKEGDVVDQKLAGILQRLEIFPAEIGLNLVAVYEDGSILDKKVLDIDEDAFKESIMVAASQAHALTLGIGLPTTENITQLLSKAQIDAQSLADGADIVTKDNVGKILSKAESQASAVNNKLNL